MTALLNTKQFLLSTIVFLLIHSFTFYEIACSSKTSPLSPFPCHKLINQGYHNVSGNIQKSVHKMRIFDLDELLQGFSTVHYLVTVTDFQGVWFCYSEYRILLRRLKRAWFCEPSFSNVELYTREEFVTRQTPHTNYISISSLFSSPFLTELNLLRDIYEKRLNVSIFWKRTKPWQNEASIDIFPSTTLRHVNLLLPYDLNPQYTILPSPLSKIRIFVLGPAEDYHEVNLINWMLPLLKDFNPNFYHILHDSFYWINTSLVNFVTNRFEDRVMLRHLITLRVCQAFGTVHLKKQILSNIPNETNKIFFHLYHSCFYEGWLKSYPK